MKIRKYIIYNCTHLHFGNHSRITFFWSNLFNFISINYYGSWITFSFVSSWASHKLRKKHPLVEYELILNQKLIWTKENKKKLKKRIFFVLVCRNLYNLSDLVTYQVLNLACQSRNSIHDKCNFVMSRQGNHLKTVN